MGKRLAENDITPDDIDALKRGEDIEQKQQDEQQNDSNNQIAERKIIRVKRHQTTGKNVEVEAKGTFKLSGSLNGSSTTENKLPSTSLFGSHSKTNQPANTTSLFGGQTQTQGASLFGNTNQTSSNSLFGSGPPKTQGGLFGNQSQPSKPQSITLFGKTIETPAQQTFGGKPIQEQKSENATSLFGNKQTSATAQVDTKTLFGGPVKNGENCKFVQDADIGQTSLFAQNVKKQEDDKNKADESKPQSGGLFSKPATSGLTLFGQPSSNTGSLFGNPSASSGGGLFGKPQNSLFGGTNGANTGSSLFGQPSSNQGGFNFSGGSTLFGNSQQKKEEANDNDEDDDTGNPKDEAPTFKAQPQQESPFEKIFNQYVSKFKIVTPKDIKSSLGCGNMTLEKDKNDPKKYFVCFRNTIGKLLYQGQIINKVSKKRRVTEKANKRQIKIALVRKDPASTSDSFKLQTNFLAINFEKLEQLEQFEKDFDKAMDALTPKA